MLEVKGLRKQYGSKEVLKGIDLTIQQGEIFGFLGRNGAGKSTFINILTGLARPTAGTVTFFDGEVLSTDVKKRIGVLPDYSTFYTHMTALDHILYFTEITGQKISKQRAIELLQAVGLGNDTKTKVGKFSFGMKKKLGFAQAIAHDPQFIFLDEPTSGVDAESSIELQNLMRKLQKEGKTIFLTSHNLDEIEKLCHRIAILKDGNITKIGAIRDIKVQETANLSVTIKHGALGDAWTALQAEIEALAMIHEKTAETVQLQVASEQVVARILRLFHEAEIDVYRVDVEEKSLEDIFIEKQTVTIS